MLWSPEPPDAERLDRAIETWLRERHGVDLDFEVADAVDKLIRLEIVQRAEDGTLAVLPLGAAVRKLRDRWASLLD